MASPLEPARQMETPRGGTDRALGFVFMGAFSLLGLWSVWRQDTPWIWAFAASGVFGLTAVAAPSLLSPLNRAWTAFGALLHRITSPIVLGLLFFGVFTPMALFMAALGKRPLPSRKNACDSYWIVRTPPGPSRETLRNPY